ncbi:MAG: U32 family peptidase C-terminal domain-containing protein [Roseburia sp.]|nr:U32 family peptidase C-terminal domain-containing protein [Roseburia sp.]MCM1097908.1 U32 family peptidase C-terminal domain-containing protein [Ruminococcus flavefaciens]
MADRKKPELLVPAGSLEVLRTAVIFGADAVYIGGEAFGLRAKAKNFSREEMAEGIAFAHAHGVKVYVTANILAHNGDLEEAGAYFEELRDMKPERCDALIISDPGMFEIAREVWPEADIHISTQANNTNYGTCLFWRRLGAKRVVSARELTLAEIREIRGRIPEDMEIESFVHGSMCISYSGRCLLSNYFTGRDANQGACTHPCRWKYAVMEESRPGEFLPVYENERGTYIFNSKDLCMIEHIPEMAEAGIDSFKIEGRMKNALYVATVARTYRKAIDDYFASEETYRKNMEWYRAEISKCTYRQYSTGFYFGKPDQHNQIYDESTYVNEYIYLGTVEQVTKASETPVKAAGDAGQAGEEPEREPRNAGQAGEEPEREPRNAGQAGEVPEREPRDAGRTEEGPTTGAAGDSLLARLEQKNKFAVGDRIEIMKPDGRNVSATVEAMYNEAGEAVDNCPHAGQIIRLRLSAIPEQYDILRRRV